MKPQQYIDMGLYEDKYWWFSGKKLFIEIFVPSRDRQNLRVLDIGSGTGGVTQFLSRYGKVTGVEINRLAVELAQKRPVDIVLADANSLPFSDESFDFVTILDLLYHQDIAEEKVLSEAYRVLKKNGKILIMDCALPFLWSKHDMAMSARKRFVSNEINSLLTVQKFKLLRSSYVFMFTLPFLVLSRFLDKFRRRDPDAFVRPLPFLVDKFFLGLVFMEGALLGAINMPVGSTIIALGEKE